MGRYGIVGWEMSVALAVLAAMSDGNLPRNQLRLRQYDKPIGPPFPASRQMRRVMERQAKKSVKA